MNLFLYGVIFTSAIGSGIYFLKFWKVTRDPLFLFFAVAFGLFGIERLAMIFLASGEEYRVYLIRLAAFILIIAGIIQKNRPKKESSSEKDKKKAGG